MRFMLGFVTLAFSLWVSLNALWQTRLVYAGETLSQAAAALFLGRPVFTNQICSEEVHQSFRVIGPDRNLYQTWHPSFDGKNSCYFDHEHGSPPHLYAGFASSGLPAFGYSAAQAELKESHDGYKVFVSNDDLYGHSWMITLHQDTGRPDRAAAQFHTLDWHISTTAGDPLVDLHLLADFGHSQANCSGELIVKGVSPGGSNYRSIPTTACASSRTYEAWQTAISLEGIFYAEPNFEVGNPITVVDPGDLTAVYPTCLLRQPEEGCSGTSQVWNGVQRGVLHPGQLVRNKGPEVFYTDVQGNHASQDQPGAVKQFVANTGWDSRQCCGPEAVFYIQTYSQGVYVAAPQEPLGLAVFSYGLPRGLLP